MHERTRIAGIHHDDRGTGFGDKGSEISGIGHSWLATHDDGAPAQLARRSEHHLRSNQGDGRGEEVERHGGLAPGEAAETRANLLDISVGTLQTDSRVDSSFPSLRGSL